MTVGPEGRARIERYWQFQFAPQEDRGERYYVDGVRERFEEAVRRQLMSDVPVGSYLSGGMDSGSICAVASRQIPHLHTFTGGFHTAGVTGDEALSDERAAAESMAVAMGTEHYQMLVQPADMPRVMPSLIWHLEDLRVGSSYHNYYVARLASRFVKVVLSGAGGDELFGGYPWRYRHAEGARDGADFVKRYAAYWSILVPEQSHGSFFAGALGAVARGFSAGEAVADVMAGAGAETPLDMALTFEARTYLQGLFAVEDKLSMAHSLESRVPFLDNDLVDFATAIPARYKLRQGESKLVLRRAMRGLIPDHILSARKQGFAPPEDAWYRGPALPYLREVILSPRSLARGYFQPQAAGAGLRGARGRGAGGGASSRAAGRGAQPQEAAVVAAVLRVVEPGLRGRRASGSLASRRPGGRRAAVGERVAVGGGGGGLVAVGQGPGVEVGPLPGVRVAVVVGQAVPVADGAGVAVGCGVALGGTAVAVAGGGGARVGGGAGRGGHRTGGLGRLGGGAGLRRRARAPGWG